MDVKIKDRKEEIEFLRMACNMAELGIGYQHADLIIRLQERLKKMKGKFSLKDGVETLTDNEPFVVEVIDGLYKWDEGWNRMIALKRLCEQGKIPEIKGKSWVAHGLNKI
jgi:hypothetical protein